MLYTIKILFEVLFGVFLLILFLSLLMRYISWRCNLGNISPKISFRTFKSIADIKPNGLVLHDDWFTYKGRTVEFKSFIDVLRYKKYCIQIDRKENKDIRVQSTIDFIKDVQKDIDKYKQTEDEKIKKYSEEIIKQVKESTERYEKLKGELYVNS